MTFKEIQELIKLVGKSDLAEFKMRDGEFELSLRTKFYGANKQVVQSVPATHGMVSVPPVAQHTAPAPTSAPQPKAEQETQKAEAESAPKSDKKYLEIKSPIVGTFYRSPSPEKGPYVKVGDTIKQGDVVCIVEAMKLFNEIESDITGTIVKVIVEDAQPVEYDQVLFLVDPS